MKRQKAIIVKTLFLRKLRNNLRRVITLATFDKSKDLIEKMNKLDHLDKYDDDKFRTQEEAEESKKLEKINNDLGFGLKRSIYFCNMCKEFDKDMVYFPFFHEWFCIDCYNAHYEGWMRSTKIAKEQADLMEDDK